MQGRGPVRSSAPASGRSERQGENSREPRAGAAASNSFQLAESPEARTPRLRQPHLLRAAADPVRPRQLLRLRSPHDLDQLVRLRTERLLDELRSALVNLEHDLAQLAMLEREADDPPGHSGAIEIPLCEREVVPFESGGDLKGAIPDAGAWSSHQSLPGRDVHLTRPAEPVRLLEREDGVPRVLPIAAVDALRIEPPRREPTLELPHDLPANALGEQKPCDGGCRTNPGFAGVCRPGRHRRFTEHPLDPEVTGGCELPSV